MVESTLITEKVEQCPLCGKHEEKFLFWNYDRLYRLPGKFGTVLCKQCQLIRLSPRPTVEAIGAYYPEDYGAYRKPTFSIDLVKGKNESGLRNSIRKSVLSDLGYDTGELKTWEKLLRPVFTKLFYKRATYGYGDLFPRHVKNGKALEIGCGNAAYLSYLKYHGWDVVGLDLSSHSAKAAKENFDIDVFVGQVENAPFPNESFDYIHLSHVVEHFYDPLESMKKVYDLLKPGGIIYVEVPNAEGISAKMSGEYWYGWDAPRHLYMFTPETLKLTLTKAGFEFVKMKSALWDSFSWESTYKYEEKSGEKLEVRPSIEQSDSLKIKKQLLEAKVKHFFKPLDGDFISCWAVKPK